MKKYLLFSFNDSYPYGGVRDLHDRYATLTEAIEAIPAAIEFHTQGSWQIYNCETGKIEAESDFNNWLN